MNVLVTGGAGLVGESLVQRLYSLGHRVLAVGRRSGVIIPNADYVTCDITEYDQISSVMAGIDGVVHLAALPSPEIGPADRIYQINCAGTFNVYQSAAERGVRRVVSASSINAVGYFWGIKTFPINYLPLDEKHPQFTTDVYSFSKQSLEDIAKYFWRREGISGAAIRIPWIYDPSDKQIDDFRNLINWARDTLPPLFADSAESKRELLNSLNNKIAAFRSHRPWEWPSNGKTVKEHRNEMSKTESLLFGHSRNFFTNLDARDSAQAFERALTVPYDGYHTLFANDSHNSLGVSSAALASLLYPEAEVGEGKLRGTESLVSINRARKLIGFEPEFSLSRLFKTPVEIDEE